MHLSEENSAIRELLHQLATDLRVLADGLTRLTPGSREWLEQVMGDLFDIGEDARMLKSEVAKGLVINDGATSGLFRRYSNRRGLAFWMFGGALQTLGNAHEDLALALEQLMPARYWREMLKGTGKTLNGSNDG